MGNLLAAYKMLCPAGAVCLFPPWRLRMWNPLTTGMGKDFVPDRTREQSEVMRMCKARAAIENLSCHHSLDRVDAGS